ncbi:TerB family tellurite resistance protein [Allomuricauda sp. SCSIO 65647]|uniref:TerB family tellurite resistance protein n=1 Tax=Allomuricauda sp. SCSIO 65647 TaxID=2908843 RepID=UPI001F1C0FB8|nr:TerB family tellurite resistance protein [Muricauda sp. SCSIO 65647]UJH66818.1 TerB family tellurite resistance protein [Muricauda sp. SCSIO 65647]
MSTYEEKLSILSEMIAFARVDNKLKPSEYSFLLQVASRLGVEKNVLEDLLKRKAKKKILKSQAARIVQFHRLLLMMNIDQEQHEDEIRRLHEIGLSMGLPPSAVAQVLEVMHQYPDKIIPPEVLLRIFTAHYN